jgi:hypothetical protein
VAIPTRGLSPPHDVASGRHRGHVSRADARAGISERVYSGTGVCSARASVGASGEGHARCQFFRRIQAHHQINTKPSARNAESRELSGPQLKKGPFEGMNPHGGKQLGKVKGQVCGWSTFDGIDAVRSSKRPNGPVGGTL